MIKFGIDSYVIAAPWSLILSILMFSGACVLGFLFLKFTNLDKIIKKSPIYNFSYQPLVFNFINYYLSVDFI